MSDITQLFFYDQETGWFTNRRSRGRAKIGERAGSWTGHGYRRIIIGYAKHYEHHLAWLYVYGEYPAEIDHINGIRDDNRIANLRPCTRAQNCHNSERDVGVAGIRGAYFNRRTSRWFSKIELGDQTIHLGTFNTPEEAGQAYTEASMHAHGEFAIINRGN